MPASYGIYEFGSFRLDPVERLLLSEGQVVGLSPKALDLLIALVSKAGRVVEKDEIDGRTVSRCVEVDGESRVVELSRMLSGHPDSNVARRHAAELLEQAGVERR